MDLKNRNFSVKKSKKDSSRLSLEKKMGSITLDSFNPK